MGSRRVLWGVLGLALLASGCAGPAATATLAPTAILVTATPQPTRTARQTATPPPTLTATPSATRPAPTATRAATATLRPTLDLAARTAGVASATDTPRAVAGPPVLLEPGVDGSTMESGTVFRWAWPGEALQADEYFQPQLLYDGVYYGVVAPTKDYAAAVDPAVRLVLPGVPGYAWVDVKEEYVCCDDVSDPTTCHRCTVVVGRERSYDRGDWTPVRVEWVVAVVQWDGADPAHIGAVVARSAPRPIRV